MDALVHGYTPVIYLHSHSMHTFWLNWHEIVQRGIFFFRLVYTPLLTLLEDAIRISGSSGLRGGWFLPLHLLPFHLYYISVKLREASPSRLSPRGSLLPPLLLCKMMSQTPWGRMILVQGRTIARLAFDAWQSCAPLGILSENRPSCLRIVAGFVVFCFAWSKFQYTHCSSKNNNQNFVPFPHFKDNYGRSLENKNLEKEINEIWAIRLIFNSPFLPTPFFSRRVNKTE